MGSPYSKDHNMLGSVLGPPIYGNHNMYIYIYVYIYTDMYLLMAVSVNMKSAV